MKIRYIHPSLIRKFKSNPKSLRLRNKGSFLHFLHEFEQLESVEVYNGNKYINLTGDRIKLTKYRLGELLTTRKFPSHIKQKGKNRKR